MTARATPTPSAPLPLVVAITGASGAPYAVRLVEVLAGAAVPIELMVSAHGWRLLDVEAGVADAGALKARIGDNWRAITLYPDNDRGARPASGSHRTLGMVICPCSMGTVAAIAAGTSRSLIERAADVVLKERRRLVVVPRETPLSLIHLRNLTAITEAGATVLPAAPGFYHRPREIRELVDFVVQRIVDQFGLDISVAPRWREGD